VLSADGLPTRLVVTRSGIRTRRRSTVPCRYGFDAACDALLPLHLREARDCGVTLDSPVHFRRGMARPVSCYALLKWWLLLSQHPGCLRDPTSFDTERHLGGLGRRSGLFPSGAWSFSPTL
jgi:hypothetical protein